MFKQLIITAGFFGLIQIWMMLPLNSFWWSEITAANYRDYKKQKRKMSLETRWQERHAYNYIVPKQLAGYLDESKDALLMPPKSYFLKEAPEYKDMLQWLDPRWFYYMAEKKVPLIYLGDSAAYEKATYTILVNRESGFYLENIQQPAHRDSLLSAFKKTVQP